MQHGTASVTGGGAVEKARGILCGLALPRLCPRRPPPMTRRRRARAQLVSNYLVDPGFWRLPLAMRAALAAMPTWVSHMTGNAVMDGDGVLLFGQARAPGAPRPRARPPCPLRLAARRARHRRQALRVGVPGPAAARGGLFGRLIKQLWVRPAVCALVRRALRAVRARGRSGRRRRSRGRAASAGTRPSTCPPRPTGAGLSALPRSTVHVLRQAMLPLRCGQRCAAAVRRAVGPVERCLARPLQTERRLGPRARRGRCGAGRWSTTGSGWTRAAAAGRSGRSRTCRRSRPRSSCSTARPSTPICAPRAPGCAPVPSPAGAQT